MGQRDRALSHFRDQAAFPADGACRGHHETERGKAASGRYHLWGQPVPGLSIAGARAGMTGARSGLFAEQIRVIGEMRNAEKRRGRTGLAVRPRYGVWENVAYALKHIRHVMCRKQLCKAPPKNAEKQHHQALFLCT